MIPRNPSCGARCLPCEIQRPCDPCRCCIPDVLCVTLEPLLESCDCDAGYAEIAYDEFEEAYIGEVTCGLVSVDVRITIEMVERRCYTCLESECLGLVGEDRYCIEFSTESDSDEYVNVEWYVDLSECGNQYCTYGRLSIAPAERIRPDCDANGCLCRTVCVFFTKAINSVITKCIETDLVSWDENTQSWQTIIKCDGDYIDLRFELSPQNSYSNSCYMKLGSEFLGISTDDEEYHRGSIEGDISEAWEIRRDDVFYRIFINCAVCETECGIIRCCGRKLPRLLTATFEDGCPWSNGASVPLVWDEIDHMWKYDGAFPGQPLAPLILRLSCASVDSCDLILVFWGSVCVEDRKEVYDCSCDPLEATFTINTAGLGCCGIMYGPVVIKLTITE